jgi:hypothetical protein
MLRNNFSAPLYRKGVVLSDNDSQTVLDIYQQWLLLMTDLGYLTSETLLRTAHRLWDDITKVDVLDLNNSFAECLHLIRMQTSKGFKVLCGKISSHLFCLITDDLEKISLGDVHAAKRLVQLFSYTSRLSLNDIDLTQQQLDDYMDVESNIRNDFPVSIIRPLNMYIKRWMGRFLVDEIIPQHGPGGVAKLGRCSIEVKYNNLYSDRRLEYSFGPPLWPVKSDSGLSRTSQTIFVPKSYKSFRTISMEPATLQYYQQGVWRVIEKIVSRSPYLRNHIGFRDQTRNKRLAQEGSINRNYATIDLSSASDSVSYELVKQLFRGTWLSRYFLSTRSTSTELPDGRIVQLKKFAPMGSALCFPIETLIFAAVCELVTKRHRISGQYSVFGDDIIVPVQCTEDLIDVLNTLGFSTNRSKSFYLDTCWFRESCGGEYCDGYDVTPMRVSRKYVAQEQFVRLSKLIDMANTAYNYQFLNLRYFFIRKLRDMNYIPLFGPNALLGDNYSNYHTKTRWNRDLQLIECRVTSCMSKVKDSDRRKQDEAVRYHHWLNQTFGREFLGFGFQSVICQPTMVPSWTWRQKPFEALDQALIDLSLQKFHQDSLVASRPDKRMGLM